MPTVTRSRSGQPFSFRPTETQIKKVIPELSRAWGEERGRALSRVIFWAWMKLQQRDLPKEIEIQDESVGKPLGFRPSAFEEDTLIPDLMNYWETDRSGVLRNAIQLAYDERLGLESD